MEEDLGIKYKEIYKNGKIIGYANCSKNTLIFYADDFVITSESEADAQSIYDKLQPYLAKRGLALSEEKTRITTIDNGFDFLGLNVRMYRTSQGDKLLIKPSGDSIKRAKEKLSQESKNLYGSNVTALVNKLNPIITGTANYWSPWVSKLTYGRIDNPNTKRIIRLLQRNSKITTCRCRITRYSKKGELELYVRKRTRTVLRREREGNLSDLADVTKF